MAAEAEFVATSLKLSKQIVCAMIHVVLGHTAFVLLDGNAEAKTVVSSFLSTLIVVNTGCTGCELHRAMFSSKASSD